MKAHLSVLWVKHTKDLITHGKLIFSFEMKLLTVGLQMTVFCIIHSKGKAYRKLVLLVETIHSDLLRKLLLKIWLSLALHFLLLLDFYLFSLMFLYSLPMMESDSKWIKPKCKNPYLNVKISLFCRFFHSFSILLFYLVDLRKFRRFDGSWLLFRFS